MWKERRKAQNVCWKIQIRWQNLRENRQLADDENTAGKEGAGKLRGAHPEPSPAL